MLSTVTRSNDVPKARSVIDKPRRRFAAPSAPLCRAALSGLAFLMMSAASMAADESPESDEGATAYKVCLVPFGVDNKTPPTLRLAGMLRLGSSTDPNRASRPMIESLASIYIPTDKFDDPVTKLSSLNFLGAKDVMAGRYASAQTRLDECLRTAAQTLDVQSEATCANNLGVMFGARGDYAQAKVMFERASRRFRDLAKSIAASQSPGEALKPTVEALLGVHDFQASLGIQRAELNLGNLAVAVGQLEDAESHFRQSLDYQRSSTKPACKTAAANDLARLYARLGRQREAGALVAVYGDGTSRPSTEGADLIEIGAVALGTPAAAPASLATLTAPTKSEPNPFTDPLSALGEPALLALLERAERDEHTQPRRAIDGYAQTAVRASAAQRPEIEVTARATLMRLYSAAGQPAAAIYHGKRAAMLMQTIRDGQAGGAMSRAERRTYLRDRRQVYARLAQLLVDEDRLVEAESVLRMLKEDEGQQFQPTAGKASYATLAESAVERTSRQESERAARAIRQIDADRTTVGGVANAVLMLNTLADLERQRLDLGSTLVEFVEASRRGGSTTVEGAFSRAPLETQKMFASLFEDSSRLTMVLLHLREDAPGFRATPSSREQLSRIDECLRRVGEVRTAFAPMLERLRRQPGVPAAQAVKRGMDGRGEDRMGQMSPAVITEFSQAIMQTDGAAYAGRLQRATGIAMTEYLAAMTGMPSQGQLGKIDAELRGLPPEQLDAFSKFVKEQGQTMGSAPGQATGAAAESNPFLIAGAAAAITKGRGGAADLKSLLDVIAGAGRQSVRNGATGAGSANAAGPERVRAVQVALESAVTRARAQAAPPMAAQLEQAINSTPSMKAKRADEEAERRGLAIAFAEPLEKLWRAEQTLERVETEQRQAEARASAQLARAKPDSSHGVDETLALLAQQTPRSALLYYLPGEDRLDILLVTAKGRKAWRVALPRARLESQLGRLQVALRSPHGDPRPEARAMYDMLFEPVARDVRDSGARVVGLSLAGKLRFVPFAALHDGENWLAERYALAVLPGARLADVLNPSSSQWRVAGFGVSSGGAGLPALPGVGFELRSVVREDKPGANVGALPGRSWIDGEFTAQALRSALSNGNQVVHIASHFKFEPGDAAASFLLLGGGARLSLRDLGGPDYRFDRTELVTLSACQTGLSEDDGFGQEVDGLAALLMAQGAQSVLASMWQVGDDSTAALMGTFYGAHERHAQGVAPLSRAESLQAAQVAMIRGSDATRLPGATSDMVVDGGPRGLSRPGDARASSGGALGRAHPYHWASFVLMGNWR